MGVYIYTLRKATRNVNIEGVFQPVRTFKYAYKESASGSWGRGDWGRSYLRTEANAFRTSDAAWEDAGKQPCLAAWGDEVWLITRPLWNDGYDAQPGIKIGTLVKVGGRWHCTAQETTVELARAATVQVPA